MDEEEIFEKIDYCIAQSFSLDGQTGADQARLLVQIQKDGREKFGSRYVHYATIFATLRASNMTTNNVNTNTGGGGITGSNIGVGNTLWATNIEATNKVLTNSKNMDKGVKGAIGGALSYVEAQPLEDDEKAVATKHVKRVAEQMEQPKGKEDKGIVMNSLDWLKNAFTGAAAIKTLYDVVTAYMK